MWAEPNMWADPRRLWGQTQRHSFLALAFALFALLTVLALLTSIIPGGALVSIPTCVSEFQAQQVQKASHPQGATSSAARSFST